MFCGGRKCDDESPWHDESVGIAKCLEPRINAARLDSCSTTLCWELVPLEFGSIHDHQDGSTEGDGVGLEFIVIRDACFLVGKDDFNLVFLKATKSLMVGTGDNYFERVQSDGYIAIDGEGKRGSVDAHVRAAVAFASMLEERYLEAVAWLGREGNGTLCVVPPSEL